MITNPFADQSKTETDTDTVLRYWGTKPKQPKPPKPDVIKGSCAPGIAAVACKSDVSWAKGLLVADRYNFGVAYQARSGYPTANFAALDTGFWVWADRKGLSVAQCRLVLDQVPVLEWADFRSECIEGSDIRPAMFDLNVQRIVDEQYEGVATEVAERPVFEALNIPVKRFYEGFDDNWNRQHDYGGEIYAFISDRSGFFNCKPRIPQWDSEKGKYRKYESRRKSEGEEGNKVFFPNVDQLACDRLIENFDLDLPYLNPDNYWATVLAFPHLIRVGVTEGGKKAISLTGNGYPCVAVLGVANWSVGGSQPRLLLPELAQLASGGRSIDIWYDMDDMDEKIKAFLNGRSQAWKLTAAVIENGANAKSRPTCWDLNLGKGIDDALATVRSRGEEIATWIADTINYSRHREIYSNTSRAYRLDPKRAIERDTVGDYLPDGIKIKPGHSTVIIADTGSGKTHQIKRLIDRAKMMGMLAVVFTPTNKLGEQAAQNFGIPHRNEIGADGLLMDQGDVLAIARKAGGLVICPDSIEWARLLLKDETNYLVICDEAAKVLEHLSSGATLGDRFSEINENFAALLTNAQSTILAEAKLSEQDLVTFEGMSGKPSLVYRHHKETGKREVTMFTGEPGAIFAALMAKVVERLERGERVAIPTDSQVFAAKAEKFLQERFPHLKGIRNDAHTSYLQDVKTLTRTPNHFLAQRQVDYLIYSPVCKAGWDLTGFAVFDDVRHEYHFDAVCAFFGVLPTSDHIQMVARYRPNVPLSIACPEMIKSVGDEIFASKKVLAQLRAEEIAENIQDCGMSDAVRADLPLQKILDEIYIHHTVRNGLEKSIARYSLQQRLIEDGHHVTLEPISLKQIQLTDPQRHLNLTTIRESLKRIGGEIDRQWGDRVAAIELRLIPRLHLDDLSEAARIERLEAPTPDERAKAAKIRLVHRFPGVDFDESTTAYHSTRKYGKLGSGADLHAKLSFEDLVRSIQRDRNTRILIGNIVAPHHLSREAKRIELLKEVGIMKLMDGEYSKLSPEMIDLKAKCVALAKPFKRCFGLDFKPGQEVMTFYCRLMAKLSIPVAFYRPQGSESRVYRVQTLAAILEKVVVVEELQSAHQLEVDEQIAKVEKLKAQVMGGKANLFSDAEPVTPKQVRSRRKQMNDLHLSEQRLIIAERILSGRMEVADSIASKLDSLIDECKELEVRGWLYDAAMMRMDLQSTSPINSKDIGLVDSDSKVLKMDTKPNQLGLDFRDKRAS